MANCCVIDLFIEYNNEEDAQAFINYIKQEKAQAKKENRDGIYMGCDRYFFDVCEDNVGEEVSVSGWVKWALNDEDIVNWVNHIKAISPFHILRAYYQEPGFSLYGCYDVDPEGQLSCMYVPEERFPDYDDDNFWEDLDCLLQTDATIYTIKENING